MDSTKGWINKLFFVWLLLLPFNYLTKIASVSADKIMAPVLIILWLFFLPKPSHRRELQIFVFLFLFLLYILATTYKLMGSGTVFFDQIWRNLVFMGYYALPLLYIRDLNYFKKMHSYIIVFTLLATLSAFCAAIGVITLPKQKFATSRVGFEEIPKALGFLGSYGDIALGCSLTSLYTFFASSKEYLFGMGGAVVRSFVVLSVMMGLIACQSRNMLLSICVSLAAYLGLSFASKGPRQLRQIRVSAFFAFLLMVSAFTVYFSTEIVALVSAIGGERALGTAAGRIESFKLAWEMFSENILTGVDIGVYRGEGLVFERLHNMWLGVALKGGLPAVLLLLLLFFVPLSYAIKSMGGMAVEKESVIVAAFMSSMFFAVNFYVAFSSTYMWFFLGYATSFVTIERHFDETVIKA